MQIALVGSVLGRLLMLFSVTMLTPVPIDLYFGDGSWPAFVFSFGAALTAGFLIWLPFRRAGGELKLRDGFLIVALFWVVLGSFGAAPLHFATRAGTVVYRRHVRGHIGAERPPEQPCSRDWTRCPRRSCSTASNCNGWAVWASWSWRWPYCRCWA